MMEELRMDIAGMAYVLPSMKDNGCNGMIPQTL